MAYSAKSQKEYNQKCNRVVLKYTEKEESDYIRLIEFCNKNSIQKSCYIKELIKKDLDEKE